MTGGWPGRCTGRKERNDFDEMHHRGTEDTEKTRGEERVGGEEINLLRSFRPPL